MSVFDNLLVVGILLALSILAYCKIGNKTLADFFMEIKEVFQDNSEEVIIHESGF